MLKYANCSLIIVYLCSGTLYHNVSTLLPLYNGKIGTGHYVRYKGVVRPNETSLLKTPNTSRDNSAIIDPTEKYNLST